MREAAAGAATARTYDKEVRRDLRPWIVLLPLLGIAAACGRAADVALLTVAFVVTLLLVPAISRFARRVGAVARSGGRRGHGADTPVLGGLAIYVVLLAVLLFVRDPRFMAIALGCTLMACTGAFDDIYGTRPRWKLLCQFVAVLPLVAGGVRLEGLSLPPFGTFATGIWEIPLLAVWVLGVTNAINFIDGTDGLASGVCLVAVCALAPIGGIVGLVLVGSLLAFLRFNLPRANIFLGDAGSLPLGYVVATLPLVATAVPNVAVVLGVLAYPLGDLVLSTLRRLVRGKPVYAADRGHLHHLLARIWKRPSLVLAGLLSLAAGSAWIVTARPDLGGLAMVVALWAAFGVYVLRRADVRIEAMLAPRRAFRRVHALRRYASCSLELADTPADVLQILTRIAQDMELCSLAAGGLAVTGRAAPGADLTRESADCGTWSYARNGYDEVFVEERHTVLSQLTRQADAALRNMEQQGGATPVVSVIADLVGDTDARVLLVVSRVEQLLSAGRLAESLEEAGLRTVLVGTCARDALLPRDVRIAREPDIDLDVEPGTDAEELAEQRFAELLEIMPAACVLIERESPQAMACAHAAAQRHLPVAHMDGTRILFWSAARGPTRDKEFRCSVSTLAAGRA